MKNFIKYLILMAVDLIVVGAVAGSVVRTIVYAIVGQENHHVYMIVRVTLLIVVFLAGCLIINAKNDDKKRLLEIARKYPRLLMEACLIAI